MALDLDPDLYQFDTVRAQRAQDFIERICVHTKGRFARKPFILEPWQRDEIIRPLFGSVTFDDQLDEWVRQYTLAWIELGRKNGKSEILSACGLLLLCADDEESAEVYGAACDKDQASLVYQVAKRMVELSPILSRRLTVIDSKKRIVDEKTNSFYQVLAADGDGALGTNPSAVLFDEVLTQPNRELWDALKTGMGTRKQPLMIAATTAGTKAAQFALEEHEYGERVAKDPSIDPARFVFMRNVPTDADWKDESLWPHANPALGSFLSWKTLRDEAKEADEKPQAQNAFRQFRLNQWVSQTSRWLDMHVWADNNHGLCPVEAVATVPAFGGLDLASSNDFAAWCVVVPDDADEAEKVVNRYDVFWRFWVPRAAAEKRTRMKEQLAVWERDGWLTVQDGDVLDFDLIEADIHEDMERFTIPIIGYDPWQSPQIVQHIESRGVTCVKVPQTTVRLNAPSKEIERVLTLRGLNHQGNPVAAWMADNVEAEADKVGQVKPSKQKSADKIDGISALCNAMFVALLPKAEPDPVPQVFSLGDYL